MMVHWDTTMTLGFFGLPGNTEMIVILIIGLLIFGRRLPEVGRSLGRSIVEFKKGVKGIEDEVNAASEGTSTSSLEDDPARRADLPGASIAGDKVDTPTTNAGQQSI